MPGNSVSGPDFLIIGGQRCATTWLANNLRLAQGVWVPPIKELHYFDQQIAGWGDRRMRERISQHFGKRVKAAGARVRRGRSPGLELWDLRYFGGRRSDRWYARLFAKAQRQGLIAGEATPAYALLDDAALKRIRSMNPHIKLIYVMRDPIERAWSGVNNSYRKARPQKTPALADKIEQGKTARVIEHSCYAATMERLERVFEREQILYGFYEDVVGQPRAFVERVLRHIGVEQPDTEHVEERAYNASGAGRRAPEEFRRALAPLVMDDLRRLCSRCEGYPCEWLDGLTRNDQ